MIENITNKDETWTVDIPACEWDGVTCNDKKELIEIHWQEKQ